MNKQVNPPTPTSEAGAHHSHSKREAKTHSQEGMKKGPGRPLSLDKIAQRAMDDDTSNRKPAALRGQGTGERGVTAKQQHFAHLVAQGSTLTAAYRSAYNAEGMADKSVWTAASVLADVPKVARCITEEVERIERERPHDDAASRRLVREYLVSVLSDSSQKTSDRTRAAELLGKVAGVALFSSKEEKPVTKPTNQTEFDALFQQLAALVKGQPIENAEDSPFLPGTGEEEEGGAILEEQEEEDPPTPETPLCA